MGKFPFKFLNNIERSLFAQRGRSVQREIPDKRRWRLLQVEAAFACNLRCVMCPWREIAENVENHGLMSPEIWQSIRPHLSEINSIDFTGGGEPLLQPNLPEWIAEGHAAGCETGFLSNGLLLKKEKLRQIIDAGVDWICISMDGADAEMYEKIRIGSNFDRVCGNVARIADLRNGNRPKTMINFVLMDLNFHQVADIVRLAARLGVDQLNFKQCEVIRGNSGKGHGLFGAEETREIRRFKKSLDKARRLAKKLNIATTAFAFTPSERSVCEQDPRDSLFIRYDGVAAPCINLAIGGPTTFLGKEVIMPDVHYGRLPDTDLMELWQSSTCKFYRQQFNQRAKKHDQAIVNSMLNTSGSNRLKALQASKEAMPEAPQGCNVCHYLYDI
ncbi:MAG: radical SAM protein [bacterium]|nr:radical SAM protein [bacterium]